MAGANGTEYGPGVAVVVVDMQNDFADPQGNLYVGGGQDIVPAVNREIRAAKDAGAFVVYTQDWHPPTTPHFQKDGGVWPVHCVQDTWGAQLHPDLVVDGPVVRKGVDGGDGYSGFSVRDPETGEEAPTQLERILREHQVERVVVVGLAQDVCVRHTVLDALRLGFGAEIVTDATRPVDLEPGEGERALAAMREAGAQVR